MKETLSTISQKTGFSVTTVSRVLSGQAEKYRISERARKIVLEEAERCNYSPNIIARNLRTNKTNTIGLILPSVSNPYFADLSSVIIAEANSRKYTTIVLDSMESESNQEACIETLMARRVDEITVAPCATDPAIFEEINKKHVHVILVDRFYEGSDLPYVTTNNYSGGVEAVNSLIRNGHRNIACIQGVKTSAPNKKRIAGYKAAMTDAGLEDNILVVGNEFSLQNGYLETKLLLNRSPRPTAMFTLSNTIALGAIKAIREAGMKIPEDISLIAFDNNIYMDFLTPPISRISQPVEDMAKLAVKLLFESIESHNRVNTKLELAPDFISRESVKKLEHKS